MIFWKYREINQLYMQIISAIRLVKNPEFHERTKHIDVRYYYVREQYAQGVCWNS